MFFFSFSGRKGDLEAGTCQEVLFGFVRVIRAVLGHCVQFGLKADKIDFPER
jgi:hypothetical protein